MSTEKPTTTEEKIQEFIEKAKQQTGLLDEGDADSANMLEKDMGTIYRSLRGVGRAEQEALLSLLEHADASVRGEAPQFVLDFEPAKYGSQFLSIFALPGGGLRNRRILPELQVVEIIKDVDEGRQTSA